MSWTCERALRRFLGRCPAIQSHPKFAALPQKGAALQSDDLVDALGDLFLHPCYTIPVMGCFRPLCRNILQRAVEKLRIVPSLVLESSDDCDEIGEEDINIIDFYIARRRSLKLHELACLAFCRALDMSPFLLKYVLSYFRFSPPPFWRLFSVGTSLSCTAKIAYLIVDVVRVTYRLLAMEPKVFSELWDWSIFLDLIDIIAVHPLLDCILDIRWCALQILSVVLRSSDRTIPNSGMKKDDSFMCLLRWEEFCQDTSFEKAGWYLKEDQLTNASCSIEAEHQSQLIESFNDCSLSYSLDGGSKWSLKNKVSCKQSLLEGYFVLTTTLKESFEMVRMALHQKWPVLLYGPASSGKTALINEVALKSGKKVLFIHMDEQMDSKSLIGSYICSEQPGEFKWQPGSLTHAILSGLWVVFEDIDKAPNEVQSIILPLLEGSSSLVTGNGEVISVSESFRLFGTVSTSRHEIYHPNEGRFSVSVFWRKVVVRAANMDDMKEIIAARYPVLDFLSSQLVETFECVNSLVSYQMGGMVASSFSRFSLRDLLKWCKRIAGLFLNFTGPGLSISVRQHIYQEAIDVFVACLTVPEIRLLVMREIANLWGVPPPEETSLCLCRNPELQMQGSVLQVGRVILHCVDKNCIPKRQSFIGIKSALHSLERIACSVRYNEPILLVGETGTGKTTLVQNLAMRLGQSLIVMNLSQQSDATDLLGGFKPADARSICIPLYQEFKELFCKTFSEMDNEDFLRCCEVYVIQKKWKKLLRACQKPVENVKKLVLKITESGCGSKRKRPLSEEMLHLWDSFSLRLDCAYKKINISAGMSFKFVEGAFITALKSGKWLLLDEVNLAPPETLQRIIGVLDGEHGTICLAERGDVDYVPRHPNFRLFACMNPATDAGKKELPFAFRSRFTEYFIDDVLDDGDLTLFVSHYIGELEVKPEVLKKIVQFYKAAKKESEERLQDSANQKPQFSLRSLARALEYTKKAEKEFGFQSALYDGFCMFFVAFLDGPSANIMHNIVLQHLLAGRIPSDIPLEKYFLKGLKPHDANYVITKSIRAHLKNLARAVFIKRYPVLLQGPTSSGKTSLVQYLALITEHQFVRINNHEHTDLQEYFGSYIPDAHGQLQFQEGVLVKAVRRGYWIVLDELNLAPSDVLESLNRLLDDNRELFLPELQETIPAHPDFMLFATQNPPTIYGGRKVLSRAFRNRFLEMHVDEIPEDELAAILEKRCSIPASYASRMVEVMKYLQLHRQNSKIFAGKHGFITPRDLFRWANRFRAFGMCEDLAKDGYFLLAERLRDENEKNVVRDVLERHLRVKLNIDGLYKLGPHQSDALLVYAEPTCSIEKLGSITWTRSMQRLYFLLQRCYKLREPVLLVGDTGGGKTTVCQLLSAVLGSRLHILNCHQYTETSDFIGGFHPVRERPRLALEFKQYVQRIKESNCFLHFSDDYDLSPDICQASLTLCHLDQIEAKYRKDSALHPNVTQGDFEIFEKIKFELMQLHQMWQTVFTWQDGPLVKAMKEGDLFLVDEISLADDSVLERLNSVLEQERKLLLAEKGGPVPEMVTAHPNFFILATMNPGGDYGKKELSPALRNRFTEIWVPPVSDIEELKCIALENLSNPELTSFLNCMLSFWKWFNMLQTGRVLTVRDFLSWISFINATEIRLGPEYAILHGAFLVLLDGLSMGTGISSNEAQILRKQSLEFLIEELKASGCGLISSHLSELESYGWGNYVKQADSSFVPSVHSQNLFGIDPFYIFKGDDDCKCGEFEFMAPTTRRNVLRVLRAMQLPRPVLLEGSPGVGKTSLIVALAQHSGHTVVRINLSEQTDMMDLLGSDLPVEGASGMEFSWADGILLQALKKGSWVLLDELNLAPQSVLEGLNAILDHRAEVYIPELGQTFKCPASFRVFACQNPSSQGGGRKGLPKSFLNRFTKVHVDELAADDFLFICQSIYPSIHSTLLSKLITFNSRLYEQTMVHHIYGQAGSPWEFNLRDVLRSCEIIKGTPTNARFESFLNVVYIQRMRTAEDRVEVMKLYEDVFGMKPSISQFPEVHIDPQYFVVGSAIIERNHFQPTKALKNQLNLLPGVLQSLEAVAHCVQRQWLCILVGPSSSGKTSMIRMLAQLTGNVLNELSLSPATDVTELLGCFEQYNSFRCFKAALSQIEHFVDEYFSLRLELNWKDLIAERKNLFSSWFSFISSHSYVRSTSSFPTSWMGDSPSSLDPLLDITSQLKHDVERFSLPVSWSLKDLDKTLKSIQLLQKNWLTEASAKFEWVPGNLVKAIECGEWVILDNANLCNPTVLDRINSLVEPDGSITVNECGLVDGKPLILKSHSKFRMFIAIDPKFGEVSRAMRNRGVEIFLLEPHFSPDQMTITCDDVDEMNTRRFLIQSGIPLENLISAMSKAHLSAKAVGFHHGVRITLLELSRWVQLFQQLIMNGNQPTWSLQLSWEHTYLAALGEPYAREFVMQGKSLYLGEAELYKRDSQTCCSLSLPGGWPLPHTLKNFIHYSRESCVKQNCLYLEFLGGQCASYNLSKNINWFSGSKYKRYFPIILPLDMLHQALFLCTPCDQSNKCAKFDYERTNQMLFFAANWTLEQATESDVSLYILWFKWYNTKLQPHCHFFGSFSKIVEKQIAHPIWSYITRLQKELLVHHGINISGQPITILSSKLVQFSVANPSLLHRQTLLMDAIQSGSLLRRTYKQWNAEDDVVPSRETFQPTLQTVLNSLRQLECEVLKLIVEHDELFDEYSCLLEIHSLFWEKCTSSIFEHLSIIWSWLKKQVMKFQPRFPAAVDAFLVESRNLKCVPGWKLDLVKPTLWIRGGHPYIPSSSVVFYKQRQIRSLCAKIWQSCKMSKETCSGQVSMLDVIVSANSDLRRLAMEGDSMSRVMLAKGAQSCALIVHQLDDIHQSLLSRFEHERMCLEPTFRSTQYLKSSPGFSHATCCVFSMEDLCQKSCFESWSKVLLLLNRRSLSLDIVILLSLSKGTLHDDYEAYKVPAKVKDIIQQNLDYSLDYSSRSPLDFSAHQILLWCFDACNSLDSVHPSFASLVLEMWFRWHKSLWNCFSERVKIYPWAEDEVSYFAMFPARSKILGTILQGALSIKDYNVYRLMLRVTSRALWQDASAHGNLIEALQAAADFLFKQILLVHEKHFDKDAFGKLKCMLFGLKNRHATPHEVQTLRSLIMSSGHGPLTSLMELVIEPLLKDLYVECKANDSLYNLGHAWVHLGVLRFNLLSNPDQTDPALKNAFKHSWILQRITLLELEMKVRWECQTLSGKGTAKVDEKMREKKEKLEMEKNQVQEKVVFRPEPSKYKKLKSACAIFSEFVSSSAMSLLNNLKCHADLSFMIKMAQNWQITSECFNNRLSEEFADYIDLVQPVQLAVYEMKFGLSLVISGILEREYVNKTQISNIDTLLASIYSIMQFPKILPTTCNLEIYQNSVRKNILNAQVLDNLIANSLKINPVQDISPMQLQLVIYHIAFIHVVHNICSSLVMDKSSFLLLNEILVHFSSLWMGMKSQAKTMDAVEAQYYKFKPRSIIVDEFMERDISSLSMLDSDGNLPTESQELILEQEFAKVKGPFKKVENIEDDWTMTSESISNSVVHIHNQLFGSRFKQLFGSRNLVERPGITCDERLRLFKDSYRVGSILLEGLEASYIIDDNLLPEYLLRVSLEHYERSSSSRVANTCSVYGDAEAMFKMVEPLSAVQRKVQSFLDEWPDHPGLIKIMDIIETLLDIPACSPLSKALLGLQLVVSKIQFLQENDSRFSFKGELQPIFALVSSWQKLEVDSWPDLLHAVWEQHDINAGELWFPMHAILHRNPSGDSKADINCTIQSVEDLICTSSVGEFRSRLHLLLALHGQLKDGVFLEVYSSPLVGENIKVLYNAFGYYVQFLQRVLEHIKAGKESIEKDLREYFKIFWDSHHNYSSIENFRKTRQKIWKLIQKFNDILQEPVLAVLNLEAKQKKEDDPTWLDLAKLQGTQRFIWFDNWIKKANEMLENLNNKKLKKLCISFENACVDFKMACGDIWTAMESVCRSAAGFSHVWKNETRNLKKRRSFNDLLKILEKCGLSRHKMSVFQEIQSEQPRSSFLQPSYNVRHLLLQECNSFNVDISADFTRNYDKPADQRYLKIWGAANKFYFKSLGTVQQLHEVSTSFCKDLSLELVNQAVSYIDHLVAIQREQRSVAYGFSEQLSKLWQLCHSLGSLGGHCSLSPHQDLVFKYLWQQKETFDNLLTLSKDMLLLLVTVKKCHADSCSVIRDEADSISAVLHKSIPLFVQSKDALDKYLLGSDEVVTTAHISTPFVVSKQIEELLRHNLHIVINFKDDVNTISTQTGSSGSIKESLLNRLRELIHEAKKQMSDFSIEVEASNQSVFNDHSFCKLNSEFIEAFERANEGFLRVFEKVFSYNDNSVDGNLPAQNIPLWTESFKTYVKCLHLELMYDDLVQAVTTAKHLVSYAGVQKPELCSQVGFKLRHLHNSLEVLLEFCEGIHYEFLDSHRTVAEITDILAHLFILLFCKGFGTLGDEAAFVSQNGTQEADGTGMGEGEGAKDVSDQIEDEAQLHGNAQKQDVPDHSDKVPSDKDKGIEMDDDFAADAFSVSEDSEDSDDGGGDDGADMDIERKMGETGDNKQIVDEKLWDKNKDDKPKNSMEKYESGPSVEEKDISCRELRAKQEDSPIIQDSEQFGNNESNELSKEEKEFADDEDITDNMALDKNEMSEEPTGAECTKGEQNQGDECMDELPSSDMMEEGESVPDESDKDMADEDMKEMTDEDMSNHMDDKNAAVAEGKHDTNNDAQNTDGKNVELEPSREFMESDKCNFTNLQDTVDSGNPLMGHDVGSNLEQQMPWSNSHEMIKSLAPSSILNDEYLNLEMSMLDSAEGSRLAPDQPQPQDSQEGSQMKGTAETNPYRSLSQAMESWKERVSVLDDPQEDQTTTLGDMVVEENAAEYRFVSEGEKSTSQALGPATADQIENNMDGNRNEETGGKSKEGNNTVKNSRDGSETKSLSAVNPAIHRDKFIEESSNAAIGNEVLTENLQQRYPESSLGNIFSFRSSYMNEEILPLDAGVGCVDPSTSLKMEEISSDSNQKALADWRRYDLATTRLSQELAEQLRLVMEPTLASRLQGDYKTGKRINMKKIIPYIASHFRRDKIWLRRTRPNKRDYQVVVAIDDSRSMSESNCGNFAIEALVTVCRAMSHLEVGQFAVASFGEKGKIKLLHDFADNFTGQAGVKIISSLSFKQDNTIADEPVVDLLKYLNNMLDAAVARARTPSGQNPLHQLILIIADGRFHEKENLRRCVRNVLHRKRMIAFILLDSPQESIMDLMEASFEGQTLTFKKYLNAFPFPFYIVLKHIEALPRTLADLLRQWFELMQGINE